MGLNIRLTSCSDGEYHTRKGSQTAYAIYKRTTDKYFANVNCSTNSSLIMLTIALHYVYHKITLIGIQAL